MSPYNPYLTPQQRQSNEIALQQQIGYLQSQLQNLQAIDQLQQPVIQNQPQVNQSGIGTQIVESFDNILAQSVPMDSNGAIFALKDGSEIQHRKWTPNGQIEITKYKPISEPKDGQGNNSTSDSENHSMGLSDALDGIYGRFDDLSSRLGVLEQSILGVQDVKEREVRHGESANGYDVTQPNDSATTDVRKERTAERIFQQFRDVDERPASGGEWRRTEDERNRREYLQEP